MPIRHDRSAAPLAPVGKLKASTHLKIRISMQNVGAAYILGSLSRQVYETLQFVDRRQSPIRIPRQSQIAAVLHCLVPTPPLAAILRGPHEPIGWIDPVPTRLSLLSHALSRL